MSSASPAEREAEGESVGGRDQGQGYQTDPSATTPINDVLIAVRGDASAYQRGDHIIIKITGHLLIDHPDDGKPAVKEPGKLTRHLTRLELEDLEEVQQELERGASVAQDPPGPGRWLPEEFWAARPALAHIRQAAHARQRSADAVLHVALARMAAGIDHRIKIPPIVGAPAPLCYFPAVLAQPGTGKSTAAAIGAELVPLGERVAVIPAGTGEGITEILFEMQTEEDPTTGKPIRVKRQTRYGCFVYIDEGEMLTSIAIRQGATLLSVLRSIWSGGQIGQANASEDRKRVVPAGQYTYGVVVGVQEAKVGPILEDVGAGTPQRFAWTTAVDPNIPGSSPAWPGPLSWSPPTVLAGQPDAGGYVRHYLDVAPAITKEIRAADLARARGEVVVDEHQSHALLLRLKIAGLLGILEGRLSVTEEDWHLAGVVKVASDANLAHAQDAVRREAITRERQASDRMARRQVNAEAKTTEWYVTETAKRVTKLVANESGISVASVRRRIDQKWRPYLEDAIRRDDRIEEVNEATATGSDKRSLYFHE